MKFHGWHQWIIPHGLMVGLELLPDEFLELNNDEAGFILDLFIIRFFFTWQKEKAAV